jgi:hypothetical protein
MSRKPLKASFPVGHCIREIAKLGVQFTTQEVGMPGPWVEPDGEIVELHGLIPVIELGVVLPLLAQHSRGPAVPGTSPPSPETVERPDYRCSARRAAKHQNNAMQ